MSWRTVVITKRCKLDLKIGCMVVRGEDTMRIFLDEVAMLVIENPAVSLTGCLLEALIEKKVRVIFCDNKHSPMAELQPYNGSHDCSRKIKSQVSWDDDIKGAVWADIISEKIRKQADFLSELNKERESERDKMFITVNMRSFYPDDVITSFIQTAISHEYKVMMLESKAHTLLSLEDRLTVDADLCEF